MSIYYVMRAFVMQLIKGNLLTDLLTYFKNDLEFLWMFGSRSFKVRHKIKEALSEHAYETLRCIVSVQRHCSSRPSYDDDNI